MVQFDVQRGDATHGQRVRTEHQQILLNIGFGMRVTMDLRTNVSYDLRLDDVATVAFSDISGVSVGA